MFLGPIFQALGGIIGRCWTHLGALLEGSGAFLEAFGGTGWSFVADNLIFNDFGLISRRFLDIKITAKLFWIARQIGKVVGIDYQHIFEWFSSRNLAILIEDLIELASIMWVAYAHNEISKTIVKHSTFDMLWLINCVLGGDFSLTLLEERLVDLRCRRGSVWGAVLKTKLTRIFNDFERGNKWSFGKPFWGWGYNPSSPLLDAFVPPAAPCKIENSLWRQPP